VRRRDRALSDAERAAVRGAVATWCRERGTPTFERARWKELGVPACSAPGWMASGARELVATCEALGAASTPARCRDRSRCACCFERECTALAAGAAIVSLASRRCCRSRRSPTVRRAERTTRLPGTAGRRDPRASARSQATPGSRHAERGRSCPRSRGASAGRLAARRCWPRPARAPEAAAGARAHAQAVWPRDRRVPGGGAPLADAWIHRRQMLARPRRSMPMRRRRRRAAAAAWLRAARGTTAAARRTDLRRRGHHARRPRVPPDPAHPPVGVARAWRAGRVRLVAAQCGLAAEAVS
jgi:hypothetical protein